MFQKVNVLIAPGLGSSGPFHWQTLWEKENPTFKRIEQKNWESPLCSDWVQKIEEEIKLAGENTIVVAHSLACLAIIHWAHKSKLKIRGALLVAPPDPDAQSFPQEAKGFSPLPLETLPFPSILIASSNDHYSTIQRCEVFASAWGSEFINVGSKGHINSDSNIGSWLEGFSYLEKLAK